MQSQRRTDLIAMLASGCNRQCQKGEMLSGNRHWCWTTIIMGLKDVAFDFLCQIYEVVTPSEQSTNKLEDPMTPQEQPLDMMQDPHALSAVKCKVAADFFGSSSAESCRGVGLPLSGVDNQTQDESQALETSSRCSSLVYVNGAFLLVPMVGFAQLGKEGMLAEIVCDQELYFRICGAAGLVGLVCLAWAHHHQSKSHALIRALASFAGIVAAGGMYVMSSRALANAQRTPEAIFLMSAFMFDFPALLSHLGLSLPEAIVAMCLLLYPLCSLVTMGAWIVINSILMFNMLGVYHVEWQPRRDFLVKLANLFHPYQFEKQQSLSHSMPDSSCFHGSGMGTGGLEIDFDVPDILLPPTPPSPPAQPTAFPAATKLSISLADLDLPSPTGPSKGMNPLGAALFGSIDEADFDFHDILDYATQFESTESTDSSDDRSDSMSQWTTSMYSMDSSDDIMSPRKKARVNLSGLVEGMVSGQQPPELDSVKNALMNYYLAEQYSHAVLGGESRDQAQCCIHPKGTPTVGQLPPNPSLRDRVGLGVAGSVQAPEVKNEGVQDMFAKSEALIQELLLKQRRVAETMQHADDGKKRGPARSGESQAARELAAQMQHVHKNLQVGLVLRGWEGVTR